MSQKGDRIEQIIQRFEGRAQDAHYLGYFECFNCQLFFEAHEVLEVLWLRQRRGPNGAFYKGLIQLAGAFVHLQKSRPAPALALLKLAQTNLQPFRAKHEGLDLERVLAFIQHWTRRLTSAPPTSNPLESVSAAELRLQVPDENSPQAGFAV